MPAAYTDADALRAQAATCTGQTTVDFSVVDGPFIEKWADRDLSRHAREARAPILLTHGFVDLNVHPDHSQLYWDALPHDFPKHIILGWWYHGWPDLSRHPAAKFEDVRHRWLDATLFGLKNGLDREPRVLVEDSRRVWHEGHDWPLEPSESVTFWAASDKTLGPEAAASGTTTYTDAGRCYRAHWQGCHVAFKSDPLAATRLVSGAPVVEIVASSSQAATKWVAYLLDEAPDGTRQRITHGYADSHTWNKESEWRTLTPGTRYNWTLHLLPTAVVVDAGHRLVLLITSQDSRNLGEPGQPCFADRRGGCYDPSGILSSENVGRTTNTIHVGPDGTRVALAWVDPDLTAKPPRKS